MPAPHNRRYRDGAPPPGFFWLFAIGELRGRAIAHDEEPPRHLNGWKISENRAIVNQKRKEMRRRSPASELSVLERAGNAVPPPSTTWSSCQHARELATRTKAKLEQARVDQGRSLFRGLTTQAAEAARHQGDSFRMPCKTRSNVGKMGTARGRRDRQVPGS